MAGAVHFGYVNTGYLASRIWPFDLAEMGQKVQLSEMTRLFSVAKQKTKETPKLDSKPNLALIYSILVGSSAVLVSKQLLPEKLTSFFGNSGDMVRQDFMKLCTAVIFLNHLTRTGQWASGFDFSSIGREESPWREFLAGAPKLEPLYKNTMFVNTIGAGRSRLDPHDLSRAMGWALGRMKLQELLNIGEIRNATLSQNGRDVYGYLYLKAIMESQGLSVDNLNHEIFKLFMGVPKKEVDMVLGLFHSFQGSAGILGN